MNSRDLKKDKTTKPLSPYAISYLRFSSVIQGKGDSSRRQNAARDRWLDAHPEIPLKREMNDLGLSAFHGKHVAQGDLGDFLALCESEEFRAECARRDVYLLVENLDRLSRERILKALGQLEGILASGVKVVTLCDGKTYDSKSLDNVGEVMMAICTMARAHEESSRKSDLCKKAWAAKRGAARESGKVISSRCPACFKLSKDGTKFVVRPKVAAIVKRIYTLAAGGISCAGISRIMHSEGHPPLSSFIHPLKTKRGLPRKGRWAGNQVARILRSKYPIGTKDAPKPEDEIPGYYPAIIDEELWAKGRSMIRKPNSSGKTSGQVGWNIFRHLAFDKETDEPMHVRRSNPRGTGRSRKSKGYSYFMPAGVRNGMRKGTSWKLDEFEDIFLATASRALEIEGKTDRWESELALIDTKIEKSEEIIENLTESLKLCVGDRPRPTLVETYQEEERHRKSLLAKAENLREKIRVSSGSITLNLAADRDELRRTLRANVDRIDVNCEKKWFRTELKNGLFYEAILINGEAHCFTDDCDSPAFTLRARDQQTDLAMKIYGPKRTP
jgi:DNA invertase Pin-like site-specific DNA recombinase